MSEEELFYKGLSEIYKTIERSTSRIELRRYLFDKGFSLDEINKLTNHIDFEVRKADHNLVTIKLGAELKELNVRSQVFTVLRDLRKSKKPIWKEKLYKKSIYYLTSKGYKITKFVIGYRIEKP